jgi:hypothetical protein
MTVRLNTRNALLGLTVLPLGVAVALSWVAVGTSAFWVLLLVNSVVAYPVFIGVVFAYDWGTRRLRFNQSWWQLGLTTTIATFALQALFNLFSHRSYYDYQYEHTQIVKAGSFTTEGIVVLLEHALWVGVKYGLAACCLWLVQRDAGKELRRE